MSAQTVPLGEQLRAWRKSLGMSREVLAEKLDCHFKTISNYESGATSPKFDVIEKFHDLGFRFDPSIPKTYLITQAQLVQLADAIALLDWIKNRVPDECPEKADAEVASDQCHALIETLLGEDAAQVYAPETESEEIPA